MAPGSCCRPLLLLCLVGLLSAGAEEPDAVATGNATAMAEKVGTCPSPAMESASANCTEECQSDAGCQGNQKCCQTGCGTSCQTPNEKPGYCPDFTHPIRPLGFCRDTCAQDSDCPGNSKCCRNGCGNMTCYHPKD